MQWSAEAWSTELEGLCTLLGLHLAAVEASQQPLTRHCNSSGELMQAKTCMRKTSMRKCPTHACISELEGLCTLLGLHLAALQASPQRLVHPCDSSAEHTQNQTSMRKCATSMCVTMTFAYRMLLGLHLGPLEICLCSSSLFCHESMWLIYGLVHSCSCFCPTGACGAGSTRSGCCRQQRAARGAVSANTGLGRDASHALHIGDAHVLSSLVPHATMHWPCKVAPSTADGCWLLQAAACPLWCSQR